LHSLLQHFVRAHFFLHEEAEQECRTEALLWPQATVAGHVESAGACTNDKTPIQKLKSKEIEQHNTVNPLTLNLAVFTSSLQ
jgi:hypothetical protein